MTGQIRSDKILIIQHYCGVLHRLTDPHLYDMPGSLLYLFKNKRGTELYLVMNNEYSAIIIPVYPFPKFSRYIDLPPVQGEHCCLWQVGLPAEIKLIEYICDV